MQQLSILGCGWLGLPLAKKMVAQGFQVRGSTTSTEKLLLLKKVGIQGFQIKLTEEKATGDITSFLNGSETLIIDIPPGLRRDPKVDFTQKIQQFLPEVEKSSVKKVLFISSTSVFEDTQDFPTYSETEPPNGKKNNAQQLITVENLLTKNTHFSTAILRFGGLYAEDRHPVRFLSGRKAISNPLAPVNLIHREDCIHLIEKIIARDAFSTIFHGVFPEHPSKKEYYGKKAKNLGIAVPQFDEAKGSEGKTISSKLTQEKLGLCYANGL